MDLTSFIGKPADFAIAVFIDDRPPADRWEPPSEPETSVLLVDGNDRHTLSEGLEAALIMVIENHADELCDILLTGTDHQKPKVGFFNPHSHVLAKVKVTDYDRGSSS